MQDYLIECRRLRRENESLRARVAELEAEQAWHPASEPPNTQRKIQIQHKIENDVFTDHGFYADDMYVSHEKGCGWLDAVRWRELPPMPEVTE